MGGFWLDRLALVGAVYYLLQDVAMWIWRSIVDPRVRFGRTALLTQLVRVGAKATGIVMLVDLDREEVVKTFTLDQCAVLKQFVDRITTIRKVDEKKAS